MKNRYLKWLLISLSLLLIMMAVSACRSTLTPQQDLHTTLGRFIQAVRWSDHAAAARHFDDPAEGQAFIKRQRAREQINVTEIHIVDVRMTEGGTQAEVVLEIEYYELPSASLRRFEVVQQWRAAGFSKSGQGRWLLETPFPAFPEGS